MSIRLFTLWQSLRASYWFVPSVMALFSMVLSFVTLWIDSLLLTEWVRGVPWVYTGGPSGARGLLSTIAGSLISVAGITFSIAITTLALASQQYGSRLLRNFIRDTGSQVVLGTFIATYLYALLILRTIRSDELEIVPQISVTTSLVLVVLSLGVLIYFIHHIATSIQAAHVIADVGRDLDKTIRRLFPEALGHGERQTDLDHPPDAIPPDFEREAKPIVAQADGYLQAIDNEGLMRVASGNDILLRFRIRPGSFVARGSIIALGWPSQRVDDDVIVKINQTFKLGTRRTPYQDIEFGIDQLVEIAIRALSPGINDAFTAIICIDQLGAVLAHIAGHRIPSPYRFDDDGRLRIIVEADTLPGIIDVGLNQIRQNARGNPAVLIRLLEMIATVGEQMQDQAGRAALRRQAIMIERAGRESVPEEWDRHDIQQAYETALRTLSDQPLPVRDLLNRLS